MNVKLPQMVFVFVFKDLIFNNSCIAALIVGGIGDPGDELHELTPEIYIPSTNTSCTLPDLPDRRTYSSLDGNLLCGGIHRRPSPGARSTCIKFDSGAWTYTYTLDVERKKHVSWTPQSGSGTYLMGDYDAANALTTSLLKPDGTIVSGFSLRWKLRFEVNEYLRRK